VPILPLFGNGRKNGQISKLWQVVKNKKKRYEENVFEELISELEIIFSSEKKFRSLVAI